MSVGRVIGNEIDDHPNPPPVGLRQQSVEVGKRPEDRVHIAIVGHVVAEVRHGRRIERREPDRVDTERMLAAARWSSRDVMPGRSPIPSPSLSWNERG